MHFVGRGAHVYFITNSSPSVSDMERKCEIVAKMFTFDFKTKGGGGRPEHEMALDGNLNHSQFTADYLYG